MSSKYLTLDEKLCSDCRDIARYPAADYNTIISTGINVLDGTITTETLAEIAERCSASIEDIDLSVKAAGGLIWEFVKSNSLQSLASVLQQVGFTPELVEEFDKVS